MTDSDVQRVADEVVNRLQPLFAGDRNNCEMMHRGLVDEFKTELNNCRDDFKTELTEALGTVFERATGKKWSDREQVRDGISFAIDARLLTKRSLFVAVGVITVAALAWLGFK